MHVALSNTTRIECLGKISATIRKIEQRENNKVRNAWEKIWKEPPAAYFVAKVDVSEMDIEVLHTKIPLLESLLLSTGYGIFCIDYTQDFSGTLVRNNLEQHLQANHNMHLEGDGMGDGPTILDNTGSVGNNVLSWIRETDGYTTRTKIYNKIVSNFEAGKVQQAFGGHLADYVECSNVHLGKTFFHIDVQARGCTRIEVSIYAYRGGIDFARSLLQNTLSTIRGTNNFVVQPAPMQWKNLAAELDRCCIVANAPKREIVVAWYGHSKTGRIAGVSIHPPESSEWEKAVQWTIAEFGFRQCPIFRIDILSTTTSEVEIGKLQCYTKNGETTLAPSTKPTKVYKVFQNNLQKFLPSTDTVLWSMRTKKLGTVGQIPPRCAVQEVSTIRNISTLSTASREKILFALLDKIERERMVEKMQTDHDVLSTKRIEELAETKEVAKTYIENQKLASKRHILYHSTGNTTRMPVTSCV
jgi:hypothetical protein